MATTKDLQKAVHKNFPELSTEDIEELINITFSSIKEELKKENRVEIRAFGNFFVKNKDERIAKDPRNGLPIKIPSQQRVRYKMSKLAFKKLNSSI